MGYAWQGSQVATAGSWTGETMSGQKMGDLLEALRTGVPGCQMVAFADLSAGLVLSVSVARKRPQEELDALCSAASDILDGAQAQSAARALAGPVDLAVALHAGRTLAVLRSPTDPVEALICTGTPEMRPAEALAGARRTLAAIGVAG